jgi:hypothetical protein
MATPAPPAQPTPQKKTLSAKAKHKDILIELVAELQD